MKRLAVFLVIILFGMTSVNAQILEYAKLRINQNNNPELDYQNGDKWWFFIFAGEAFGGTVFFDMSDYMEITDEGKNGIITCVAYATASVGFPVGFGAVKIPYDTGDGEFDRGDNLPDLISTGGISVSGFTVLNWQISGNLENATIDPIDFMEWSEVDCSIGIGSSGKVFTFEMRTEILESILDKSFSIGISPLNWARNTSLRYMGDNDLPVFAYPIRRTTISDKWQEIQMKFRYENLVVNKWGSVYVDVTPLNTAEYRVDIYDDLWNTGLFNFLPPEWDWDNTFMGVPRSSQVQINAGETRTFKFNVKPDDNEGDFCSWLYTGDDLFTLPIRWATTGDVYASSVEPDTYPPFVISVNNSNDPGTSIEIVFNEPISIYSVNDEVITITGSVSGPIDFDIQSSPLNDRLSLDPVDDLIPGETVQIFVSQFIQDVSGNRLLTPKSKTINVDLSSERAVTSLLITAENLSPASDEPVRIDVLVKDQGGDVFADQPITFSHSNTGSFSGSNPAFSSATGIASISYTPSAEGSHIITATSANGKTASLTLTVGGSAWPPSITLTYPNNEVCHDECVIAWSAYDPDSNPAIYLHYDTDNSGYDGTCINPDNPINKDVANAYMWNTASMAEGVYWVYATINDGTNEARDYSPGYIEIKHPELSADFDYSSRSIDEDEGDGDQIIESGEFFELEIRIRNEGTEAYYQVNAILTSGNSNVSITDDDSYYGEFAPGVAKWGENDFYVRVNQGYVGNVDFDLSITFKDAEGYEYYQVIDIPDIYVSNNVSPGFAVEGIEIVDDGSKCNNDGILQSGENSIQYRLLLRNSGTGNAIDVYCNAQALPEGFDTGINGAGYPDIAAGTAQWPDIDDNYYLREIPYDYSGTLNAELMVTWADGEFNQLVPFSFDVHPAPRLRYFPETTDFGIQPVGGTAVIPITLTNYGSADIVVTQIEDISANPDNSITGVTFPLTINPSGSVVINFNISRSSPQNVNETFRIHSNNHIVSTQDILISGTFYNPQPQGYKKLWESPGEILPVDLDDCKWIEPGDFDNDGLIEVVMYRTNMVHFWEQTSAHSFEFEYKYTFTVPGVDPRIFSLKAGNCDGDNKLDIVIKHTDQGVEPMTAALRILEASGDDIYSQVWSTSISDANIYQLEVGNCDSDVYDEIIIGTVLADDALVVYNRTGDNNYQATWNSGATIGNYCSYIGHITTGDTDKDGRNEIILIGEDEYIFIWEYNGSYTLAHSPLVSYTTYPDWGHWAYPSIFDVDGDNKNEIIITSGGDDSWKFVVFNPDTWSIDFKNSPGLYGDLTSAAIADLNGNGIPEIFFGEEEAPYRLIVYESDNGSFFETFKYLPDAGDDIYNIEPFDLNGDGTVELLVSNDDYFMVWGYEEVPVLPDLQIAANNFTFSPEEVTDAEEINIIATIHNIGTETATDIPIEFYLTHPDNGNRIDSLNIPSIGPSGSQLLTINWNLFQTGNFEIYVVIDRLNAIDELTEDNNIQAKTISIIDNDTIPPIISNNTHSEFYGDDDGLIEDNEYINISWNIVDESGVNSSYVLLNDLQTITAMPSGGNSYYAVLTNQSPGLLPYEIHATDNDNSALLSVVRDTILILKHAPDVTSKLPENGAVDVPLDTEILAFFDLSLDATTINSNTVLLSESATGISIAPVSVTWSPELNRVSFIPSKLEYSTGYTIRLVSGPSGIADINGNTLEADYSWTFTTISEPLDADFVVSDQNPEVGESISFLDISSGNPISWLWDFGDGSTSNEQNPTYFYSTSGSFTVTLTINDQSGNDFETKESFITAVQTLQSPTVTTATLDNIAIYAAQGGGTVTNDGGSSITARGVCWSTSPGPTVEYSTYTIDGAGTGEFSSSITGITPGTTYYLRAYAKNAIGTGYGDEIIFTTYNADAIQDADGNYYNIVTIGNQTWMAENLKTTSYNDFTEIPNVTDPAEWITLTTPAYCWYDNDEAANKDVYGALYNWHAASNENLCPTGWHVPTDAEWTTLTTYLGGESLAGGKLKEAGLTHWASPNTGATDESGFTALPGGLRSPADAQYYYVTQGGYWWSSTERISSDGWARQMFNNTEQVIRDLTGNDKNHGFSVRCVRNPEIPSVSTNDQAAVGINTAQSGGNITSNGGSSIIARGVCWSTSPLPTADLVTKTSDGTGMGEFTSEITGLAPGTTYYLRAYATNAIGTGYGDEISFTTYNADAIQDIDGNYYNQVTIGSQTWLAENLRTTRYNDGSPISNVTDNTQWFCLTEAAYCWYDNDISFKDTYGALYNWYAATEENLCPQGWHVPTYEEWWELTAICDGDYASLKEESGAGHWLINDDGTNETGFTALPGGRRNNGYTELGFNELGYLAGWWGFTGNFYSSQIYWYIDGYSFSWEGDAANAGYSVRCLRNAKTQQIELTEGWNLVSFALEPDDMTMSSVIASLTGSDPLVKVQDEEGRALERLADPFGWINDIGVMSTSEGYKIRVSENTSLSLAGSSVALPVSIPLEKGWNYIGYPFIRSQSEQIAFNQLRYDGTLVKVQNEQGASIEKIDDHWIIGFSNLNSGEGYKVKTNAATSISYQILSKGSLISDERSSAKPVHFIPAYKGNGLDHMNIYLSNYSEEGWSLHQGDEIGIFDDGVCVGAAVIENTGNKYIPAIVSLDDPVTQERDGFTEGDEIEVRLWDGDAKEVRNTSHLEPVSGYSNVFEKLGTTVLKVEFRKAGETSLGDAYPNPSDEKTTFTFNLAGESRVRFEIFDTKGQKIRILLDKTLPAGHYEIEWDNKAETGSNVKPGVYLYRLTAGPKSHTKQLVIH